MLYTNFRMGLIMRSVAILLMVIVTTVSSILHLIYKEDFSKYVFSSSCALKVSVHAIQEHGFFPRVLRTTIHSTPDGVFFLTHNLIVLLLFGVEYMQANNNFSSCCLGVRRVLLLRTVLGRSVRLADRIPIEVIAATIIRR